MLSQDGRETELPLKWEEAYERGEDLSAESLCRERPELITVVQQAVDKLKRERSQLLVSEELTTDLENTPPVGETELDLPQLAQRQIGRYVIEGELGRGGIGIVYRARDGQLNRSFAIKVLLAKHLTQTMSTRGRP